MGLFKNPMVLMLGFTGVMAFVMPKMLVRLPLFPLPSLPPQFPMFPPVL
jgi:hypothetical protein